MKRLWLILLACFCFGAGVRENPKPIRIPDDLKQGEDVEAWRNLEAQLNATIRILWEGVRSRPEVYYGYSAMDYGTTPCDTVIIRNFDGQVVHYRCDTCFVASAMLLTNISGGIPVTLYPLDTLVIGTMDLVSYRIPAMISDSSFAVCFGNRNPTSGSTYILWQTVGR